MKGWVKPWRGYNLAVKKIRRWDGRAAPIALAEGLFLVCQVPVKQFVLTRGFQSRICEVGMGLNLVRNISIVMNPYSIDR